VAKAPGASAFGPFRLFPAHKLLLEGDAPVRIGSRALDILIALVERAGDLVTKKELLVSAWPTTTVDEANLRVHIAGLRKLLGDGQSGARYIVNVAGRGYRFVGGNDARDLLARIYAGFPEGFETTDLRMAKSLIGSPPRINCPWPPLRDRGAAWT
jgi:DNA-binding winged helix-turn-helix (wHTH) protein